MKLNMTNNNFPQPDPFIFAENDKLYIFATGLDGVHLYSADSLDSEWIFNGSVCSIEGCTEYWAPSVTKINGKYYMYFSCRKKGVFYEYMYVASSDNIEGPYTNSKRLYNRFTIDSHVVETKSGLYLFYAENNVEDTRKGTRIFIDKLLDPETPANICKEIVSPSFDEEISAQDQNGLSGDWYTLEGPYWLCDDKYQYLMYSGGAFVNDTYHVGYCVADASETDLINVKWTKHTGPNGEFEPLLIKNDVEEGTGHNSAIKIGDNYYIIYHARDYGADESERTARYRIMKVKDGIMNVL